MLKLSYLFCGMDDDTLCDISPINGNLINTIKWSGPYLVLSALLLSHDAHCFSART